MVHAALFPANQPDEALPVIRGQGEDRGRGGNRARRGNNGHGGNRGRGANRGRGRARQRVGRGGNRGRGVNRGRDIINQPDAAMVPVAAVNPDDQERDRSPRRPHRHIRLPRRFRKLMF